MENRKVESVSKLVTRQSSYHVTREKRANALLKQWIYLQRSALSPFLLIECSPSFAREWFMSYMYAKYLNNLELREVLG